MKKLILSLIMLLLVLAWSCQRSQFSTTTRHVKNGRVTYSNHHGVDRIRSVNARLHKNQVKETNKEMIVSVPPAKELMDLPAPEIKRPDPVKSSETENLIASTSNEPSLILAKETMSKTESGLAKTHNDNQSNQSVFIPKNSVKSNPAKHDNARGYDGSKTETWSLVSFILSFLGFIPAIGIIFSILSIIFGLIGLGRINRSYGFKGKGFAIAGIIIGITGLIFNLLFIFLYLPAHMSDSGIVGVSVI